MVDDERDALEIANYLIGGKKYHLQDVDHPSPLAIERSKILILTDIAESLRELSGRQE